MTIRLLIVDDHPVVRDGLRGIFEAEPGIIVVGEAANGVEALEQAAATQPNVVLLDLRMPEPGGAEVIRRLQRTQPDVRVLVLTTYDNDNDVVAALDAGATGYLLKDVPRDELVRGVRAAARNESVLSPTVARRLIGQVRRAGSDALTERELQILRLVADGATNRDIARDLFVSEATVKTHLLHIYDKLGVRDRAAAVGEGFRRGLLSA